MSRLIRFAFFYAIFAFLFLLLLQDERIAFVQCSLDGAASIFAGVSRLWALGLPLIAGTVVLAAHGRRRERLGEIGGALLCVFFLQCGFLTLKDAIPDLVPFYADPFLAEIDRWLTGGVDAWRVAHRILPDLIVSDVTLVYFQLWALPAFGLPLLVAATDGDAERKRRYLWLYALSWIVIGNILALLGSSAGPAFYDRLLHTTAFAGLQDSMRASGLAQSPVGITQSALWQRYLSEGFDFGLSISAFPSMHVAATSVATLYIWERWPGLRLPAAAYLVTIFLLSIYTGFHYATDGITSVLVVCLLNLALRRLQTGARGRKIVAPHRSVTIASLRKVG